MRCGRLLCALLLSNAATTAFAQPARPLLVGSAAAEVVLVDERALGAVHADARAESLVAFCTANTRLESPAADARVQRFRAWDFEEALARDPSTIVFLILPVERGRLDCGDGESQRRVVAARGVRFSRDSVLAEGDEIISAILYRGAERLSEGGAVASPLLFVTPWGDRAGVAQGWRIDVPLERLAPAAWGSTDDVYVIVQRSGERAQWRVGIPAAVVDSLWGRAGPRRAARLPETSPVESRLFADAPEDAALRRAHEGLAAGALRQPTLDAARRLEVARLSSADRRSAAVQLASTFAHAGDEPMARYYLRQAFATEPCLALNAETPAALARLALPLERMGGRCRPRGALRFALTGGLIPGAARPTDPRRVALGALAAGTALLLWRESRDGFERSRELYRDYLAIEYTGGRPTGPLAMAAYDDAESQRRQAVWLLRMAIGLVTASVAEGAWSEFRYNVYLRDIRDYGRVQRVP